MLDTNAIWLSIVVSSIAIPLNHAHGDEPVNESVLKQDLAVSLVAGLVSNNKSLETADLFVDQQIVTLKPGGSLEVMETKQRYLFDQTASRRLIGRWFTADVIEESTSSTRTRLYAVQRNPDGVGFFYDERGRRRMSIIADNDFHQLFKVPILPTVGIVGHPNSAFMFSSLDPMWTTLTVRSDTTEATITGEQVAMVVARYFNDQPDEESSRTIWKFDLNTLMPVNRKHLYTHTISKERKLAEIEDFQWQNVSGLYLPSAIRLESKQIAVDQQTGAQLPYSIVYDSKFIWNRVNEPLVASDFEPPFDKSPDQIKAWVLEHQPEEDTEPGGQSS